MTHVSLAEDFLAYITANWCASTISKPSTLKVMNFDRNRRIQGYTTSACLIHRGQVQFVPLDYGYMSRVWITSVMLHGTNETVVEDYILEFMRVIHAWEAAGGGAFTTGGMTFSTLELAAFEPTMEKTAVGEIRFFSKQVSRT